MSLCRGGSMINVGVIGYGYWGPNIVRNFNGIDGSKVLLICDSDQASLKRANKAHPYTNVTTDFRDVISSPDIDMVAVVTPVSTHFELAKKALQNGKHVFVEKKNLKIMVDHTFIFSGAVRKMKQLIDENALGDLYYYDSVRVNLGLLQKDINVIWDLAPHDFSIMDYLLKDKPSAVTACGKAHINGVEDTAYVTVHFANKMIAHFNVNWLSPVKVRTTLIGGARKMLVWNDLEADEKIKIYDKGIDVKEKEGVYDLLVSYRSGDMLSPKVQQLEALKLETEHFVHCITNGETPLNDGYAGLRVVKMLEACNKSLSNDGKMVNL